MTQIYIVYFTIKAFLIQVTKCFKFNFKKYKTSFFLICLRIRNIILIVFMK